MNKYDEIDWVDSTPDVYIDQWRFPPKVLVSEFERDKRQYGQHLPVGLWFDEQTWRRYKMTRLTSTPLINMSDVKPFKVDASIGKFKWNIPILK